jgi:peroxiredoxin
MKNLLNLCLLIFSTLLLIQCQSGPEGLTIGGKINGISDNSIHFEKSPFNAPFESITKGSLAEDGSFSLNITEPVVPGVYRLRTGGKTAFIVLDGTESKINMEADANSFSKNTFTVEGSPGTTEYNAAMQDQYNNKMDLAKVSEFIKTVKNPYVAQAYAGTFLKSRPDFVNYHTQIMTRLKAEFPQNKHDAYATYINQLNQQMKSRQGNEKIKVGQPAPEIAMPDMNGKIRKLSDLKGKVVLVDFWASWCGPCRRANPEVVKIYDKYNSKGFEVFSVSLDGLDEQSKRRFKLDDASYKNRIADSKKRWQDAIAKDNLKWKNHVSELTKWDAPSAREYGVTGIPKTFLIDREGKIAAVNPRFNLEEELLKTL